MRKPLPAEFRRLAKNQCGIVTTKQAVGAGLSEGTVVSQLHYGRWQRLYRGVYATFSGKPSRSALLWAAVLHCGDGAMLSHQTAAEVAGLVDGPSELIHVTIPVNRQVRQVPGIVVHRSERAAAARHPVAEPPQTQVEETILDLADAARKLDDAVGWVTRGLGRRLTTQSHLRQAMAARPRMRWRRELSELLTPDLAGLMSVLEHRHYRDVEQPHGLPRATRQAPARREGRAQYRDLVYEDYHTVIELDGTLAHPADTRWRDIRRDNAAAADGLATLRYGYLDVTTRACTTAAEEMQVVRRRGYTGGHPCPAPDCPVPPATGPDTGRRGVGSRSADSRSADSRSADSRGADSRSADSRGADSRSADSRGADSRSGTVLRKASSVSQARPGDRRIRAGG